MFFSGDKKLILRSHVATVTGQRGGRDAEADRSVPVCVRTWSAGSARCTSGSTTISDLLPFSTVLAAWDVGGGATGFLTDFVGLNWDVRLFRIAQDAEERHGLSFGPEQLSFWRATMGISIRL